MKQKKRIRILSVILIFLGAACIAVGGLSKLGVIHALPSAEPKVYDWSEMDLSKDHATESAEQEEESASETEESVTDESSETVSSDVSDETGEGGTINEP